MKNHIIDRAPTAASQRVRRIEAMTLPLPRCAGMHAPLTSPGLRQAVAGMIASIPRSFAELKPFAPAAVTLTPHVSQKHETFDAYDRYFVVVRVDQAPPEVMVNACVKALNDIRETASEGHDLSTEEEADLLDALKTVLEVANAE